MTYRVSCGLRIARARGLDAPRREGGGSSTSRHDPAISANSCSTRTGPAFPVRKRTTDEIPGRLSSSRMRCTPSCRCASLDVRSLMARRRSGVRTRSRRMGCDCVASARHRLHIGCMVYCTQYGAIIEGRRVVGLDVREAITGVFRLKDISRAAILKRDDGSFPGHPAAMPIDGILTDEMGFSLDKGHFDYRERLRASSSNEFEKRLPGARLESFQRPGAGRFEGHTTWNGPPR